MYGQTNSIYIYVYWRTKLRQSSIWLLIHLPPEQVCTTWQPTKFQVARIHLDSRSAAHYKSNLSEDPNTFVFSSIIEAQRAGFDMRQEDCDDSMCLSVKQVNDGPSRTQCRTAGVKTMTQCRDGTISTSTGRGTCSHHGGVMY